MSWYPPYVSVAQKRAKAEKKLKSLRKKMPDLKPVVIEGRTLATTWWGSSWNKNLERYADFSNRIGRGRSYVRHRAVLDLKIKPGKVTALVLGSARKPYEIKIDIKPVNPAKWAVLRRDCQGQLKSLQGLLAGKFPKDLAQVFFAEDSGLFPVPEEISFDCSCPDWADMCKHVAAALYGIGARFDEEPQLFFKLRGVKIEDLITQAVKDKSKKLLRKSNKKSGKVIDDADLGAVFGIEMENEPVFTKKPAVSSRELKRSRLSVSGSVKKTKKRAQVTAAAKVKSNSETISEAVLRAVAAAVDGCTMAQLSTDTGYPRSQLYGVVYRLKQQGKIINRCRGTYELK